MKTPTRFSNKTNNAWSCAEDQILENKNLQNMILNSVLNDQENTFGKCIYLKGNIHDWLGRAAIGKAVFHLPCRFRQLSIEIPGDVLFPQDGPPNITLNLVRKSKKFTDLRRRIPARSTSKLSGMACVSTVSGGYSLAAALSQWEKRAQGHFSRDRLRCGPCPAALRAPVVARRPSPYFPQTC